MIQTLKITRTAELYGEMFTWYAGTDLRIKTRPGYHTCPPKYIVEDSGYQICARLFSSYDLAEAEAFILARMVGGSGG